MPSNNPLPPKEKTLFNRIVKCYEQKQFKNGFKFAKQILANPKFAEHGETLAMKGLTLNCLGKKEEAYELVKRGLSNDIRSHVCWHVYGLLQRSDKKYDEAIKCYRNALKRDPENLHILRDLSMLQIHMRDMEGHRQTKYTLLQLKPAQRAPWIGYAISNHLLKDFDIAFKVLEEFRKTQQSENAQYEYSELLLYQNLMLRESGKYQQALDHLKDNEEKILDKCSLDEIKGDLCMKLHDYKNAENIFVGLLERNPENISYYEKLEQIFQPQTIDERLEIYDFAKQRYPRADTPKLIPLFFLQGEIFEERLEEFVRRQLQRGVPPLLITLKQLYEDEVKVKIIDKMLKNFLENLRLFSKFNSTDSIIQPPTTLLWALSFYGQHLSAIGNHEESLIILDEAIQHTPTLIELHMAKAKTLKHLGDYEGAVICMDEAQSLDTADRFINCKCVRYMIRNGQLKEAAEIASKFTRENVSVDDYALDMQCMWYDLEIAKYHKKAGNLGNALKKCHIIDRHFHEITQDQLEFHQYCIRKTTLTAYTRLLALEDELRHHHFYYEAARIAILVYIKLHDNPHNLSDENAEIKNCDLTSAELKKKRNKERKQERKKAAAAEKKKIEQEKMNKRKQQIAKNQKVDESNDQKEDEFQPDKLVAVNNPIEQAHRFLIPLELHRSNHFQTHYLAFMVAERRNKLLQMLRAYLRCLKLAGNSDQPDLHICRIRLAYKISKSDVNSPISDIIKLHNNEIYGCEYYDGVIEVINDSFLAENANSLPHVFAGCQSRYHINNSQQIQSLSLLLDFASKQGKGVTYKLCERIYESVKDKMKFGVVDDSIIKQFIEKFSQIYPRANLFGYHASKKDKELIENGFETNCHNGHDNNSL